MNTSRHNCVREVAGGIELTLKVVPGASRSRVVGPLGDALKVQVAQAPERGKANDAVLALLASVLRVPAKQMDILHGHTSPRKIVHVAGLSHTEAVQRLGLTEQPGV
jgi:uncharacterized protein (TIGR00251 family)